MVESNYSCIKLDHNQQISSVQELTYGFSMDKCVSRTIPYKKFHRFSIDHGIGIEQYGIDVSLLPIPIQCMGIVRIFTRYVAFP